MAGSIFPPIPPGSIAPADTGAAPTAGGGLLDTIGKVASNPLLQAALAGYLGYIGSPRRGGRGLALEQGGLGALGAFNATEAQRTKLPLEQAQLGLAQAQTQEAQNKATALQGMSPEEARAAQFGGYGQLVEGQMHLKNNQMLAGQFALAHPDKLGQQIANEIATSTKPLDPGAVEKDYQERLQAPQKAKETEAHIAQMNRGATGPASYAAGGREMIRDPSAPSGYRDVGAAESTVAKSPDPNAVTKIYQSEYDKARQSYLATHKLPPPPSGLTGYFSDPAKRQADEDKLQSEADAYAKQQAGGAVEKLNIGGGEPPPNATSEIVGPDGAVAGHRTPDGIKWLPGKEPHA